MEVDELLPYVDTSNEEEGRGHRVVILSRTHAVQTGQKVRKAMSINAEFTETPSAMQFTF